MRTAAYISALTPTELDAIGSSGVTAIVATNVDQVSVYNYLTNLFGTESERAGALYILRHLR